VTWNYEFEPGPGPPSGTNRTSVAPGEFNGDGFQDVAVLSSLTSKVSVLLGNGDVTFRAPLQFDLGVPAASSRESGSIAVGDFNSDGREGLVASTASATGVSVLLGNGDGTFRTPLIIGTGARSVSVAVGDFNNDRIEDLAWPTFLPTMSRCCWAMGMGRSSRPRTLSRLSPIPSRWATSGVTTAGHCGLWWASVF
jgi:FG-GAP-like repeat